MESAKSKVHLIIKDFADKIRANSDGRLNHVSSFDICLIAASIFRGTKPIAADEINALEECMNINSKTEPTLPRRL